MLISVKIQPIPDYLATDYMVCRLPMYLCVIFLTVHSVYNHKFSQTCTCVN